MNDDLSGTHQTQSIGESAYRQIRTDIIFGRLSPSRKLKLERLKEEYRVGISTLREILNRLQSERLVVAEGQKGFEVAPVSIGNLREIAALRQLLEGRALEQSFRVGSLEWEAGIVTAYERLAKAEQRMAQGDRSRTKEWKRCDWEFHQSLISACGSRMLIDTHALVFDKYLRYQMVALSYRGDIAAAEHAQLLERALERDADGAKRILAQHIEGGVEHALATGTIN